MIQTRRNIMLYSTLKKVLPNKPTKPPIIYFLIIMEKRRKLPLVKRAINIFYWQYSNL